MTHSFIIPIYNGHDYIIRCLDSIYENMSKHTDFEIIVVDDCSTDDTYDIVSNYAQTHNEVKLIHQPANHKQGAARNVGLQAAKGEYISFVDGDDILLPGISRAIEHTKDTQADMVYCSMIVETTKEHYIQMEIDQPAWKKLSGAEFCERYYDKGVFWYPPAFLIRRDYLLNLHYPFVEDRQCEDRDWMAYVLSHAGSVVNSPAPMYKYIYNASSTCRALKYSIIFDHTASGIRHIHLSKQLQNDCPNLSMTLYAFGMDEIYKNLRLRNLSKFPYTENRHLYDHAHLRPLLPDLKTLCQTEKIPLAVRFVVHYPQIELFLLRIANPLAHIGRKIIRAIRK